MLIIQMTEEKAREHSKNDSPERFASAGSGQSPESEQNDNNVYDRTFLALAWLLKIGWPSVNIMSHQIINAWR